MPFVLSAGEAGGEGKETPRKVFFGSMTLDMVKFQVAEATFFICSHFCDFLTSPDNPFLIFHLFYSKISQKFNCSSQLP